MSAINCTIQALLADAPLKALVQDRINPGVGGAKLPDVVLHLISDETFDALKETTGTRQARVSIECRARSFTEADKIGEAAIKALENRRAIFLGRYCKFRKATTDVSDHADDASVYRRIHDQYLTYGPPA